MSATPTASAQDKPAGRFSRHRFCMAVMLGVYPLVTALLYLVFPLTAGWPLFLKTALIVPPVAAPMVWGLIPAIHSRLHHWLHPVPRGGDAGVHDTV